MSSGNTGKSHAGRSDDAPARLTSLRPSDNTATPTVRKPKFMPRAQKRQQVGEEKKVKAEKPAFKPRASAGRGEFSDANRAQGQERNYGRGAGGRGSGGRGRGGRSGGRDGGRRQLPTGRVAFVGSTSAGSSTSSGGPSAAKLKKSIASSDIGISVLDDSMVGIRTDLEEPIQWPPVIESATQPMELPFGRPPSSHLQGDDGNVFCDEDGNLIAQNDTLFFVQLPTSLPYVQAKDTTDATAGEISTQLSEKLDLYDKSLSSMNAGHLGQINVHKSGKVVLVLGDKTFNIAPGQPPTFYEECISIDHKNHLLSMLGPITNHLVVTPDFESLLE